MDDFDTDWSSLEDALQRQSEFSNLFFDAKKLTPSQKQERLKTFCLSLHAEITGIVDSVNYKDHRKSLHNVNVQNILHKSADAYRYVLAILNLWNFSVEDFTRALSQKDDFLWIRQQLSNERWQGQDIVVFDMDDVLAEFRVAFYDFVTQKSGVFIDVNSREYYSASVFKKHNLSNEAFFRMFVDEHGFLLLKLTQKYAKLFKDLRASGRWVQIITSRPADNLTAYYDTFTWLKRHDVIPNGIAFTPEKLIWLVDQPFYSKAKIVAIEDSAKHATEYAKHGIPVLVPEKSYNTEVEADPLIKLVSQDDEPMRYIDRFLK